MYTPSVFLLNRKGSLLEKAIFPNVVTLLHFGSRINYLKLAQYGEAHTPEALTRCNQIRAALDQRRSVSVSTHKVARSLHVPTVWAYLAIAFGSAANSS